MRVLSRLRRLLSAGSMLDVPNVQEPNEDEGYSDHMVGQTQGPFYCGTAFCGHATKKAARACWKRVCDDQAEKVAKRKLLMEEGKTYWEALALVPDRADPADNPANWPCNRSATEMQAEFIARAKAEGSDGQ